MFDYQRATINNWCCWGNLQEMSFSAPKYGGVLQILPVKSNSSTISFSTFGLNFCTNFTSCFADQTWGISPPMLTRAGAPIQGAAQVVLHQVMKPRPEMG